MNNQIKKNYQDYISDEEIDPMVFIRILIRSKNFLIRSTLFLTFLIAINSFFIKPVWKGTFQMAAQDDTSGSLLNSISNSDPSSILQSLASGGGVLSIKNQTKELILKSPSVLKDVYTYHKFFT